MNAITYTTEDHTRPLSLVVSRPMAADPVASPARLKPAKGVMVAVALALAFWGLVATVVALLV